MKKNNLKCQQQMEIILMEITLQINHQNGEQIKIRNLKFLLEEIKLSSILIKTQIFQYIST